MLKDDDGGDSDSVVPVKVRVNAGKSFVHQHDAVSCRLPWQIHTLNWDLITFYIGAPIRFSSSQFNIVYILKKKSSRTMVGGSSEKHLHRMYRKQRERMNEVCEKGGCPGVESVAG